MTIGKKLFAGFLGILIILAATVAISYIEIQTVDKTYTNLIDDKANKLIMIKELDVRVKKEQSSLRGYLLIGDEASLNSFKKAHDQYLSESKGLESAITHPDAKKILQELDQIENEYNRFSESVFQLKKQNKTDEYTKLVSTVERELLSRFDQKINDLNKFQQNLLDQGNKETNAKVQSVINIVLTLGIIAIVMGVIIAIYMGRIISTPVTLIANSAEQIAAGDLTIEEINIKNRDEIGNLAKSFNQMAQSIRDMIYQVGANANQVAASAEELTASSDQATQAAEQIDNAMHEVSVGVDKQVQNVEETSQTINEMAKNIQHIANVAHGVSTSAVDASEKTTEGGHAIKSAFQQMDSINQTFTELSNVIKSLGGRSEEIGQIIMVITAIADQTNLLALNAAIEAARAGDHGKGFAVVADEVRKLAEQSSQSAQQISQLISTTQDETNQAIQTMEVVTKEVLSGIGVVNIAGTSFKQIQGSITEVTNQIQEVSAAVQQMAAGSEQIVQAMNFIIQTSESSASAVQEVSASTEEQLASMEEVSSSATALTQMAVELQQIIGKFKIEK